MKRAEQNWQFPKFGNSITDRVVIPADAAKVRQPGGRSVFGAAPDDAPLQARHRRDREEIGRGPLVSPRARG